LRQEINKNEEAYKELQELYQRGSISENEYLTQARLNRDENRLLRDEFEKVTISYSSHLHL
jgi:hypothetical protein